MIRTGSKTMLAAALSLAIGTAAQAQEVTLRFAHFLSDRAPQHSNLLVPWAAQIEAASEGRLRIEFYTGMSLGGRPSDLYDQAISGEADIVMTATAYTPGRFPRTEVFELPGVHRDSARQTTAAMINNLDLIADDFAEVHPIMVYAHAGNAVQIADGCISDPAELAGLRLRTPSRTGGWLIEELDAEPVAMPIPALTGALESGDVNGALVTFEILPAFRIQEELACSIVGEEGLRFGSLVFIIAMNKDVYDGLPEDLRTIIDTYSSTILANGAGFLMDFVEGPGRDAQLASGGEIREFSAEATATIAAASERVTERWIADVGARDIDGPALLEAALEAMEEAAER